MKILILSLASLIAFGTFAQEAPAPKFEVGDQWEWGRTDKNSGEAKGNFAQKVSDTKDGVIKMEVLTLSNGTVHYNYNLDGNLLSMPDRQFSPSLPMLKFPLKVGLVWRSPYDVSGARSFRETIEGKVVAMEQVTVPAGTFATFRIEYTTWDDRANAYQEVHWYAPAAKRVVMRDVQERLRGGGKGMIWRDVLRTYSLAGKTASN